MKFQNDIVKNLKPADNLIQWLKENRMVLASSFMAVSLSATLFACSPAEEAKVENNETTTEEITSNPGENTSAEEQATREDTVADNKSEVITSINLVKDNAKKLGEAASDAKESPAYEESLKQAIANFDVIYRWIMHGEEYEGTTFAELPTTDKIDAITGTMSIGEIIMTVEPNIKEDFSQKLTELRELAVKYGAKGLNKAIEIKDSALDLWGDIKEEAAKQR